MWRSFLVCKAPVTTLSTDPDRKLIGDDEHGWSGSGVFNCEGGCYAKATNLSAENEPQIYECTRRFGTILENVNYDFTIRRLVLDDSSLTNNTRAAYPLTHIENALRTGIGGHHKNLVMLTCDAVGVMPPIAKLTAEQAMYHFLSGYNAKIARANKRVTPEPEITFNTCFGASFMTLRPTVYAKMLGERIRKHNVNCWESKKMRTSSRRWKGA
mgnify:CR=1 FL=1|jgi:phosphoenolpyruvate carboxykinase (ATP)